MFSLSKFALSMLSALTFSAVAADQAAAPLALKVYNADANSFHVNSVLVTGKTEAVLIDSGFTRADALRIAANVLDSGKTLKAIFISNADPDYYFGVETLRTVFPQVPVYATAAVRARIQAKMAGKLAFWGPKMGANAAHTPVLPDEFSASSLTVDGQAIEVRGTSGALAHRPYLWIPSLKAIVGNIGVFNGLHVWTADTQTPAERHAWLAQLDEMQALHPTVVVPGHMAAGSAQDASAIAYTRTQLQRFEAEAAKAGNSAELVQAMQKAYPNAGMGMALDIGAKVIKGEMKW